MNLESQKKINFILDSTRTVTNNFRFEIRRCIPKKDELGKIVKECKSEKEIDNFIYDMQVDMWAIYKQADMQKFGHDMFFNH